MNHAWIAATTLLATLTSLPLGAQTLDRQAALDSMVAAEHAFADLSKAQGTRAAFLANLADDSLLFGPDLVSGPALWKGRPETEALLTWYPTFADLSLAGDLGYTTGPWEFRPTRDAKEASAQGYFVTLWKKQKDGAWKVMFDQGARAPKPASPVASAIPPATPAKIELGALPKLAPGQELALLEADRTFAAASETQGPAAAYQAVLADEARFYRRDQPPLQGREAIRAALAEAPGATTWAPAGAIVSRSNDLGYTFGLAKQRKNAESPWEDSDHYLRIWKRQPGGPWKLVVDVFEPHPPKPAAEAPPAKPSAH